MKWLVCMIRKHDWLRVTPINNAKEGDAFWRCSRCRQEHP